MTTLSQQTPQVGQSDSTEDVKLANNVTTLLAWANGSVDGANVDASLTGRRLIAQAQWGILGGNGGTTATYYADVSGNLRLPGGGSNQAVLWSLLNPANYAVAGKNNTQLVLRFQVLSNATASGITVGGQLNPITSTAGPANNITIAAGTVVSGSAVTIVPGTLSTQVAETSPFAFPALGAYVLALTTTAATAANSVLMVMSQLFVQNT